jgi:hypothetical protein
MAYIYLEQIRRDGNPVARSIRAMRHLPKIGVPRYIRGYTYHDAAGIVREAVVVRGALGSVRFVGFSWGSDSEEAEGLDELFRTLGVSPIASTIADQWEGWRIALI